MKTSLAIAALGLALAVLNTPVLAQPQGSNQAADYALSQRAASGGYGNAYASYGYERFPHRRRWR
jgi:hypothetical protein